MKKVCTHCGGSMMEYRHSLSYHMVYGLWRLNKAGGEANLKVLGLNRNQWDNFQKLRYWDLVEKVYIAGKRANGVWRVTDRGARFLKGRIAVASAVWTYHGEWVRDDGSTVNIRSYLSGYKHREEWASEAVAH